MNFKLLNQVFKNESALPTGTVLTLPSGLTKGMAQAVVAQISLDSVIKNLATLLAQEVGTHLLVQALRPPDYINMPEIPDELIERLIEALAQKPDAFFITFQQSLKIQG